MRLLCICFAGLWIARNKGGKPEVPMQSEAIPLSPAVEQPTVPPSSLSLSDRRELLQATLCHPKGPDTWLPELSPLLLNAKKAAAKCNKFLRAGRGRDAAGWIPRAVRFGCSTFLRAVELRDRIAAGCPRCPEWEARR